jgi:PTS system N-acetylglucosamine-specific IIC component
MAAGEYGALSGAARAATAAKADTTLIAGASAEAGAEDVALAERLLSALGGPSNVQTAEHAAVTRLRFTVRDSRKGDEGALKRAGVSGVMRPSESVWHVIAGGRAAAVATALKDKLDAH